MSNHDQTSEGNYSRKFLRELGEKVRACGSGDQKWVLLERALQTQGLLMRQGNVEATRAYFGALELAVPFVRDTDDTERAVVLADFLEDNSSELLEYLGANTDILNAEDLHFLRTALVVSGEYLRIVKDEFFPDTPKG